MLNLQYAQYAVAKNQHAHTSLLMPCEHCEQSLSYLTLLWWMDSPLFSSYTGCPAWTKVQTNLSAVPPWELPWLQGRTTNHRCISYHHLILLSPLIHIHPSKRWKTIILPHQHLSFFFFASSSKHARLGHPLTNMPTLLPCLSRDFFLGVQRFSWVKEILGYPVPIQAKKKGSRKIIHSKVPPKLGY